MIKINWNKILTGTKPIKELKGWKFKLRNWFNCRSLDRLSKDFKPEGIRF